MLKYDIMTIREVTKVMKVSPRTVYRWIASGALPTARLGRKTYRIFETDLVRFVRHYVR